MKQKCKTCNCTSESEYCFRHKPKKPFKPKKKLLAYRPKGYQDVYEDALKMRNFFMDIWSKRTHKSEVSGEYLGKEPLTVFFHHILSKEKYPQAAFDEENIILLTLQEHDQVEMDMYRYEEVNDRREKLLIKYDLK